MLSASSVKVVGCTALHTVLQWENVRPMLFYVFSNLFFLLLCLIKVGHERVVNVSTNREEVEVPRVKCLDMNACTLFQRLNQLLINLISITWFMMKFKTGLIKGVDLPSAAHMFVSSSFFMYSLDVLQFVDSQPHRNRTQHNNKNFKQHVSSGTNATTNNNCAQVYSSPHRTVLHIKV